MGWLFSAIVIDDDSSARNILEKFLETDGRVKVLSGLESAVNAFETIEKLNPDVIFLDINMPQVDGIQFATRLKSAGNNSLLIFCTAFRNYAMQAFDLRPYDFLVKPFGINEIFNLIEKIAKEFSKRNIKTNKLWSLKNFGKFKFKTANGFVFLEPSDFFYARCLGNGCELITNTGVTLKIQQTISDMYFNLEGSQFYKVNRSSIINTDYIVSVDKKNKTCKVKSNAMESKFVLTSKSLNDLESLLMVKLA